MVVQISKRHDTTQRRAGEFAISSRDIRPTRQLVKVYRIGTEVWRGYGSVAPAPAPGRPVAEASYGVSDHPVHRGAFERKTAKMRIPTEALYAFRWG